MNLSTRAASGGHAQGDTISGFENVTGSAHNDRITGQSANTELIGGGGNDHLSGGTGDDLFVFGSGQGNDTIADFTDGDDLIDLTSFGLSGFSDLNLNSGTTGVTIDLSDHGGGSILLPGTSIADLDASNFLL